MSKTKIGQSRPQVGAMKKRFEQSDQRDKLRSKMGQTVFLRHQKKTCLGTDQKPSKMGKRSMGKISIKSTSNSGEHFLDHVLTIC